LSNRFKKTTDLTLGNHVGEPLTRTRRSTNTLDLGFLAAYRHPKLSSFAFYYF